MIKNRKLDDVLNEMLYKHFFIIIILNDWKIYISSKSRTAYFYLIDLFPSLHLIYPAGHDCAWSIVI